MLMFWTARLVILSQQKTGTSALIHALAARADMSIKQPSALRHMNHTEFCSFICPMFMSRMNTGRSDFEVVSVMREPIDWVASWYRFRARSELADPRHPRHAEYTGNITFDQFVWDLCTPEGGHRPHVLVGAPCGVATSNEGYLEVDKLFPYEDMSGLFSLIQEKTGEAVKTSPVNVSPILELSISNEARLALQQYYRNEIELHSSLKAGGQLESRFRTMKFLVV